MVKVCFAALKMDSTRQTAYFLTAVQAMKSKFLKETNKQGWNSGQGLLQI